MTSSRLDESALSPSSNKRVIQKARTRQRLLESAYEVLEQNGLQGASVQEIARRAGISRVGFYVHFDSLIDLVCTLMDPVGQEILAHYAHLDTLDPTIENLREWSAAFIQLWRKHAVRFRVWESALALEPLARGVWSSNFTSAADLMPNYFARLETPRQQSLGQLRMTALMLQHERLCYFAILSGIDIPEDELVEIVSEECWTVLHLQLDGSVAPFS